MQWQELGCLIHCLRASHVHQWNEPDSKIVTMHYNARRGTYRNQDIQLAQDHAWGSLVYRTHTLWTLGFLVTFTLGGISGMFFPSIAMDLHLHESYFVVAHFHYVLVGGTVFGFYAAIYYWFPKMSGRMLDEKLGVLHFLVGFISYNALFWPMHRLEYGEWPEGITPISLPQRRQWGHFP